MVVIIQFLTPFFLGRYKIQCHLLNLRIKIYTLLCLYLLCLILVRFLRGKGKGASESLSVRRAPPLF